jgi:Domain of unknown function (DUF1887)
MSKTILISLIGREVIGNFRVFKYLQPDVSVHLYSADTKKYATLTALQVQKTKCQVVSIGLNNGFSFTECIASLKKIDVLTGDIIWANITGGTKPMSLALYEFAKQSENKVHILYLDMQQNMHNLIDGTVQTLETEIVLEEFIELQGQKIKTKETIENQMQFFGTSHLQLKALLINNASNKIWNLFLEKVVGFLRKNQLHQSETCKQVLARTQKVFTDFEINWQHASFVIRHKKTIFFAIYNCSASNVERYVFNGGWYELIVANACKIKYPKAKIYMNVHFPVLAKIEDNKNEVDVLINDGGKLIFVECKSGFVKTTDIDRIEIRKKTFGGLVSESILATRFVLNPLDAKNKIIIEKSNELGIKIIKI